jgi:hypothetical protein
MKTFFRAAAALLLALGLARTASATTYTLIHISGATDYRAPIHQAICDILDSGFTFAFDAGSGGTNPYKQNAAIYVGQLNTGAGASDPYVIIKTSFTGAVSGIYDLTARNPVGTYIAGTSSGANLPTTAAATYNSSTQAWTGGTNLSGGGGSSYSYESVAPDVVFSNIQASSAAASLATASTGGAAAYTAIHNNLGNVVSTTVGLSAFEWVLGKVAAGVTQPAITSITQNQALALVQAGALPVMFLTGSTADKNNYLVLVGRSEDAGQRVNVFAGAQAGFGNSCQQMQLSFSNNATTEADGVQTGGSGATVAGFAPWPANWPLNTESGIYWNTSGHSGYLAGGDLKNALTALNPANSSTLDTSGFLDSDTGSSFFIGYLSISDVAIGGNAFTLSYEGVPFSVANVYNGAYSLWSFQHLFYLKPGVTGGLATGSTIKLIADTLANKILTTDADVNNNAGASGISVHGSSGSVIQSGLFYNSNLLVTRGTEGGVITQNY